MFDFRDFETSDEMHLPVYSVNASIFDIKFNTKDLKIIIYSILIYRDCQYKQIDKESETLLLKT